MSGPHLVIISGLSGAGRTTVMKTLEDLGFYCVDNVPVVLLEPFVELFAGRGEREAQDEPTQLAAVVDVREREFLREFPEICDRLRAGGVLRELLFLDATDEALAQRFDETRRVHPAARQRPLAESIAAERDALAAVAARADVIIDTTALNVHELKRLVTQRYTGRERGAPLEIELSSFGFRWGAPETADLVLDVRFLRNPNFESHLREKTGESDDVAAYVLQNESGGAFLAHLYQFVEFLIPQYENEGKAYLRVGIGCTGGRHRSVAVVRALEARLRDRKIVVRVTHRDLGRGAARSEL